MSQSPLVKDSPFIAQSGLTARWYFVRSWRDDGRGNKVAHEKFDITEEIEQIIAVASESQDLTNK